MPRAGLTSDRVVRAGAELADEVGLDDATVSALARQLGVKVASLYGHVDGATGLQEGIARLALDELADRAAEAIAGRSGRDALVAFASAYRDYARQHPGRYAATRLRVGPDSPVVEAGRRHADLTRAVLRGYALEESDTVHAVRLLGSTVHGFTDLELGGGFDHSEPAPEESWARTLDALDATLRSWAISPPG
ncbi:TetR/AcrR family transcriptional regulator [Nocardioides mangrovi]|uniref:WHG domain-containing protein n=1 Tax=Nocardioides mangrovi TaxID=2874580 RepID=A0ABS7UAL4_9ACTN|nr:TetR/AcrR family transcriptional regulator [Nocardioides mangrovi]MBZ5737879.1 WHG domain-containing protein [Nocardioides mangrovi]